MSADPKSWRVLRCRLRELGGHPIRTKGSHEMWRLPDGEMFLVVRNHLGRRVPMNVLARYRRLRARREPEGSPSIPCGSRVAVTWPTARLEIEMSKGKSNSPNNQRSNAKNPNNAAYRADRGNRARQGHPVPPPPPPPPAPLQVTQDK